MRPAAAARNILGVFDSGLGGLTVLAALRARLPDEDLLYVADQAHAPYGDREAGDLHRLAYGNVAYLESRGVDAIVMGCNTSCAIAARLGWPPARVPILDLIAAAADAVVATGARRIGVLATLATTRTGAYGDAIRLRAPDAEVFERGTAELVPLVEAGMLEGALARAAVARAVAALPGGLDAVVLACTHFPLLDAHFAALLGERVLRLDPAAIQAERGAEFATGGHGRSSYVTTGAQAPFAEALARIVGLGEHDSVQSLHSVTAE